MPSILAIETSHPRGAVAVVRDGVTLFEKSFTSERSHNSQLFAPLAEALALCGDALRFLVVGTGPGSYTGARIGIAAAQGIALSREVPVLGLPSVLAPDVPSLPDDFVVCGDARRGLFFMAHVFDHALAGEITLHDSAALAELRSAAPHTTWYTFDARPPAGISDLIFTTPSASRLARIAADFSPEKIKSLGDAPILEPIYLAAPFITMPK
jgi:tRNA threonylcarbamoyladenosine biosynthesis protein TsaB